MPTSRQNLYDWDRVHFWHAFTQMAEYDPLIIEQAEGCRLIDIDGNAYLDGASSMWCNVHGHNHPQINRAIHEQLDRLAHCTSLGMGNRPAIEVAKRLADLAPGNLRRVFFGSDGSSAVEVAVKMAFQYWRQCDRPRPHKTSFIAFGEAYHGDTIGSASVGGIERFNGLFGPLLFDVYRAPSPDPRRRPADVRPGDLAEYHLDQLEQLLDEHHEEVAALVIEPLLQCAAGMVIHPRGFLGGVRELTRRYDVLLIADEVATGFGRTGTMFACQQEEVVPDFLCLGKGISGGYMPMSATVTNDDIFAAFLGDYADKKTLCHGHTYGGNPLAASAALASLDVFEDENVLQCLPAKAARLTEHLSHLADHPHVAHTRQLGLLGAFDLVRDKASGAPFAWAERRSHRVCLEAMNHGVWVRPLGDVIYVAPPLSVTIAELDQIMAAVEKGIHAVT